MAMADIYDDLMRPLYERYGAVRSYPTVSSMPNAPDTLAETAKPAQSVVADAEASVSALHRQCTEELREEILAHVYAQNHLFFEKLIIDVLLALGYGNRRRDLVKHLGRSHDGGVDGIILQDELGLERILLQAKRLKPGTTVSASQVRDFIGSLEARHAAKGIFVTTGHFSLPARACVESISRRVVLVNGHELSALMIRHNIGVKSSQSYVFKRLELCYFAAPSTGVANNN
jgi:restriction system protein